MRLILLLAATGPGLAMLGIYGVIALLRRAAHARNRSAPGDRGKSSSSHRNGVSSSHSHGAGSVWPLGYQLRLLLTRVMRNLLFEIEPMDPITFVSVALLLALASGTAALIPSFRAARIDPVVALKAD